MTTLDRSGAEEAIAAAAKRVANWGRWGTDGVLGTLNFLDDAKRAQGARLVRRGASLSLAQRFDAEGPQKGWRRRTDPVHTMLSSGPGRRVRPSGVPHGLGGADDVVFMPLQASTQWDGLGHIFDHGTAYNGRRASQVVTSEGDRLSGRRAAHPTPVIAARIGRELSRPLELGYQEVGYTPTGPDVSRQPAPSRRPVSGPRLGDRRQLQPAFI